MHNIINTNNTTSATSLYNNLDILEVRKLIEKHSGEDSAPKIVDIFRNMQDTIEEQMFHNRRTLQDIIEIRKDNIDNGVIYLFLLSGYILVDVFIYYISIVSFVGLYVYN
jgi:Fe2+ or Zn2+ uptake regulation protein